MKIFFFLIIMQNIRNESKCKSIDKSKNLKTKCFVCLLFMVNWFSCGYGKSHLHFTSNNNNKKWILNCNFFYLSLCTSYLKNKTECFFFRRPKEKKSKIITETEVFFAFEQMKKNFERWKKTTQTHKEWNFMFNR